MTEPTLDDVIQRYANQVERLRKLPVGPVLDQDKVNKLNALADEQEKILEAQEAAAGIAAQ